MRAVDTHVLARLIVSDDLAQQRRVVALVERAVASGESLLVTHVVLAELSSVLEASYGYARSQIAAAFRALVDTPPFVVRPRGAIDDALVWYEKGPADFADYLIIATATGEGCMKLVTFDRALLKRGDCEKP